MDTAEFVNLYADNKRADSYAKLEFARTYHLAYRDFPEIFGTHVQGKEALDFGCGAGRSTRFLREHGFHAAGIDISPDMIAKAKEIDPEGDYRLIEDGDFSQLPAAGYDLILAAFPFDNIPHERKLPLLAEIAKLLKPSGRMLNLVSSPEIYTHEWASFSTKGFPENWHARSGDIVKIISTDVEDNRPMEDILSTPESYRDIYGKAGLEIVAVYKPLADGTEPYKWVSEVTVAPWVIYVLQKLV
jgi:SAM-dependent methyltransferase